MMDLLETLKADFNCHVKLCEKRPRIGKVVAPLLHEDGDMIDIFLICQRRPQHLFVSVIMARP